MHTEDLALNDLQWLICHKTKPNQILYILYIRIKGIWHYQPTVVDMPLTKPNQSKLIFLPLTQDLPSVSWVFILRFLASN